MSDEERQPAVVRVVIVEDHTLLRQSLVKTISAEEDFDVVGEAEDADGAVALIARVRPDIAVLDVTMPGGSGLQVASTVKSDLPDVKVLMLTMHDDDATISRAVAIGADGYLVKTASTDELIGALRTVAAGGSALSPSIARRVIELASRRSAQPALTERELEILQLLAAGIRPAEVAKKLYVSIKTVKHHLTSIYSKLGVQTGAQAVGEAFRRGLVSPRNDQQ